MQCFAIVHIPLTKNQITQKSYSCNVGLKKVEIKDAVDLAIVSNTTSCENSTD